MRRLVVCCDGTWNRPDGACPTNVVKVAFGVAERDAAGVEQRVYYHPGVGTRRGERLRGGVFGYGLSRDVRTAYRWLLRAYEPGDEIFLFGFSRGAYTARSLAGLVRKVGVLRREHEDLVDAAYRLYRDDRHPTSAQAVLWRRTYAVEPDTGLRLVGVWDTVGSLGIPLTGNGLVGLVNRRWDFHDLRLSSRVRAAYQALAVDEQRGSYRPALWAVDPHDLAAGQQVEQVWFAGVHSDVGGARPAGETGLGDLSLAWMVDRAGAAGLAFRPGAFTAAGGWGVRPGWPPAARPDPLGPLHESYRGLWRLAGRYRRPVPTPLRDDDRTASAPDPVRRESVADAALARLVTGRPPYGTAAVRAWRDRPREEAPVTAVPPLPGA